MVVCDLRDVSTNTRDLEVMEWQKYRALSFSATSVSERSWWAGKALQCSPPAAPSSSEDLETLEQLRRVCLQARPTFLSPRVLGMVWMGDEEALWAEISHQGWKIEDFINTRAGTGEGTLNWQRLTSAVDAEAAPLGGMDRGRAGAQRVISSDDDEFLRAAPYLRKVSLFVHRAWLAGMSPARFAELYQDRFAVAARPQVSCIIHKESMCITSDVLTVCVCVWRVRA
jgi:hypothetical protein